jgi:hypothetical protein
MFALGFVFGAAARRLVGVCATLVMLALGAACATVNVGSVRGVSSTKNYVGRLLVRGPAQVEPETALVAFVVASTETDGLDVRAYMCDGMVDGKVLWARGPAAPSPKSGAQAGTVSGHTFDLTSPAGYRITGSIAVEGITGEIIGGETGSAEGDEPREFFAPPTSDGSGIFDLTVDAAGNLSGTSLTGDSLLLAKASEPIISVGDGLPFVGKLTTADGTQSDFMQMDLSTLSTADLASEGFPTEFGQDIQGVEPGTFRAIVLNEGGVFTSYGRLLLPGTGVTGVAPQFGRFRIVLSCAFCSRRL